VTVQNPTYHATAQPLSTLMAYHATSSNMQLLEIDKVNLGNHIVSLGMVSQAVITAHPVNKMNIGACCAV
jgi:hypothetical protein